MKRYLSAGIATMATVMSFATTAAAFDVAALPRLVQARIAMIENDCAAVESGTLTIGWDALQRRDLDGNNEMDWILNEGLLSCSTIPSMGCGSGGCATTFIVGDHSETFLLKNWEVTTMQPNTVVLMQVSGVECGGDNLTTCVEAMVWDADARAWTRLAR